MQSRMKSIGSPQPDSPRKRRRVFSDDEDFGDSQPDVERNQFLDSDELDIISHGDHVSGRSPTRSATSERALTPEPSSATAPPLSRSNSNASVITTKRRAKKKLKTVYSDDDEFTTARLASDDDDGRSIPGTPARRATRKGVVLKRSSDDDEFMTATRDTQRHDNNDEDFVPSDPPARKATRKPGGLKGRKGKSAAKEKTETEIKVKDERKVIKLAVAQATDAPTVSLAGTKRRRGESDTKDKDVDVESLPATQSTSTLSAAPSEEHLAILQPAPSKKKLPTIKKNKPLAAVSGQASGLSTPSSSTNAKAPSTSGVPSEVPTSAKDLALPKRPTARMDYKSVTERMGASDLDLSKPDIYTSLFKKSGATTPQSAERRKELDRMREHSRAERMAMLNRTAFDLLAGQDKIARFEAELKQRNSTALYPHHLASYLKNKQTTQR